MASAVVFPATPRRGAALRQAMREKNVQDLVYRSEYLASLVSNVATLDKPPDQCPERQLASSVVPRLADLTAASLHISPHAGLFAGGARQTLRRPQTTPQPSRQPQSWTPQQTSRPASSAANSFVGPPAFASACKSARLGAEAAADVANIWDSTEVFSHTENMKLRLDKLHHAGVQLLAERPRAGFDKNHVFHRPGTEQSRRVHRELVRDAVNVADPASAVDPLHGRSNFGEVLQSVKMMASGARDAIPLVEKEGAWAEQCDPLKTIKVQPVPGAACEALGQDYLHAAEMEIKGHADKCRIVEHLDKDWKPDLSSTGLNFSRFYWRQAPKGEEQEQTLDMFAMGRLRRVDGHDEFSAHRYTLMEGGSVVLRQEGGDPFHNRALVVGECPLPVLPQGHYMEVEVISLFKTKGGPSRPRELQPRHRTEGLVLGFKTQPLREHEQGVGSLGAGDMASSWSVSTSGTLYMTPGAPSKATKVAGHERTKEPASWQRAGIQTATTPRCAVGGGLALQAPLPPNSPERAKCSAGTKRQLGWSTPVGEGVRVGLLATTFGGLVVFVNGQREVMIPDAGVPVACEMFPVIEVYNHIRSVRLVPGSKPPP